MRTFSKFALTATLALGASFGLVGMKPVVANMGDCDTKVLSSASEAVRRDMTVPTSVSRQVIDPVYDNSFDPEPNDPPSGTGGAGTR